MKKFKKIIIFIPCLILLLILSFSFYNVVAEDGEYIESADACKNFFDKDGKVIIASVYDKYNPTIKHKEGTEDQWIIEIDPTDPNDSTVIEKLKDVKFQLVKINDRNVTNGGLVGYGHPLTITQEIDEYGYMSLLFRVSKEHKDPDCALETLEFDAEVYIGGSGPIYSTEPKPNVSIVPLPAEKLNKIECPYTGETVSDEGKFKEYFCDVKKQADYNYDGQFDNGKKFSDKAGSNAFATFTCDSKNVYSLEQIKADPDADDGYYLPENTGYLYGSGTYKMDNGNYIYHYDPCNPKTGGKIECSVTCEEIVTVKYGAPVASKAGLCFEYKVKVTSNVVCDMTVPPEKPEYNPSVCTPTPYCTGIGKNGRYVLHQGGPNEDYDRCIQACDGGKYTSSCSKKCYKEVYQNSLISYEPKKTDYCCNNCYTNGGSKWVGSGPGRWYGGSCKSGYAAPSNGICRRIKASGYCNDECWWGGCEGDVYLNPGYATEDYQHNIELYNQAVNACKAAASCSTTTATFTISVDYKDGSGNKVTVDFPYNKDPDKACVSCSPEVGKNNVTLTAVDGCYNKNAEDYYFAEWRFPGSWINKKTGELSYLDKGDPDKKKAWQEVRGKFCIPFDAQDVNAKWWNYYYNKVHGSNQCSTMSETPDEYNIRAVTKNFGYFGWNIKASCFYAVNNTEKAPCPVEDGDPNADIKYIVRSIDLDDVFPKTSGESLTDPSKHVGRTPGFNWSSKAFNNKNEDYVSSPLQYALNIQDKGFSIYSDPKQLDYQIYLTPEDLNDLKRKRSSDYTRYDGTHELDKNGVIRFNSNLIQEFVNKDRISVYVGSGGKECNNTINDGNYKNWDCEVYDEEVGE